MKRYETYKDSGVDWLGEIPEHWDLLSFRFCIDILTDYTSNGSFASLAKNVNYLEEGYSRLVRLTDLRVNLENDGIYVNEDAHNFLSKSELFGGEMLIANVGAYAGLVKIMPYLDGKFTLAPNMFLLRLNQNTDFFYYQLNAPFCAEQLKMMAISSAQPKLNKDNIRQLMVLKPSFEEQKSITVYLKNRTDKIDELITKKELLIQLLEEERTAIINQAVTKGLNPDAPMKDSGIDWLGEIPEHWELKKLKYVFDVISSKTDIRPDYLVALENIASWTGNVSGSYDKDDFEGTVNLFEKGDILFNKLRPYLAKVVLADKDGGAVSELLVLRSKNNINSKYMFYRMVSEMMISVIDGSTYGAKMPRANWNSFISELKIGIPNINEQNLIVEYLDQKLNNIKQTSNKILLQIKYLKEYKESLISNVVTGKIDVREEVLN